MLRTKNGRLVALSKNDQEELLKCWRKGGETIRYCCLKDDSFPALIVTNHRKQELATFIGYDAYVISLHTNNVLSGEGCSLEKFIRKYCPDATMT